MEAAKKQQSRVNSATQVLLPTFTILGFLLTAVKKPQFGLAFNLIGQVFWLYAGWQAWKKAGQVGMFVTVLITTIIILFGVVNYWIL